MKHIASPALALALSLLAPALAAAQSGLWSDPAGLPLVAGPGAGIVAPDAGSIIVAVGGDRSDVFRLNVATGAWTTLEAAPAPVGRGAALAFLPGSGRIYLAPGAGRDDFHAYDLSTGHWTPMSSLPGRADCGSAMTAIAPDAAHPTGRLFIASVDWFAEYTPDANGGTWTLLASPGFIQPGTGLAYPGAGDSLYFIRGDWTTDFLRYSLSTGQWSTTTAADKTLAPLPFTGDQGSAMIAAPDGSLLAMEGDGPNSVGFGRIFRYDAALNEWQWTGWGDGAHLPGMAWEGAGLACGGGDLVFCLRGGGRRDLWRFSLAQHRFLSALNAAPFWNGSGALTPVAGNLHALGGYGSNQVLKYDSAADQWMGLPSLPGTVGLGCGLAWNGSHMLYAAQGDGYSSQSRVWSFDLTQGDEGTWSELAGLPSPGIGIGGGITWAGDRLIAILGDNQQKILRYTPGNNTWAELTPAPSGIGDGAAFSWDGGDRIFVVSNQLLDEENYIWGSKLWSYSISNNTWTLDLTNPAGAHGGWLSSMARSAGYLYAILGEQFWAYEISSDAWTRLQDPPGSGGVAMGTDDDTTLYVVQGGNTSFLWSYEPHPAPPAPANAGQFLADGSVVPPGQGTGATAFIVKAVASSPVDLPVRLEVQIAPVGSALAENLPVHAGAYVTSGSPASVSVPLAAVGGHHWRVRTGDGVKSSTWIAFGTNDPAQADIVRIGNSAPNTSDATQADSSGAVAVGGKILAGHPVTFSARAIDPEGNATSIEVEVAAAGAPFRGVPTASGSTSVSVELAEGEYRWRVRAVDVFGLAGTWTSFGANAEEAVDLRVLPAGSTAAPACSGSAAGSSAVAVLLLAIALVARR